MLAGGNDGAGGGKDGPLPGIAGEPGGANGLAPSGGATRALPEVGLARGIRNGVPR
ncbi:hypothetical protein GCM10023107_54880 [Actinoplanes octamycinicus]|nr:hypothetical protein Aoc01nite_88600 [Actinoplanes octamycinicus]